MLNLHINLGEILIMKGERPNMTISSSIQEVNDNLGYNLYYNISTVFFK